jgi:hypothetical protein
MRVAARIALGAVEYIFTLILTSCFMMAVFRWVLNPNRGTGLMLPVFCGGLALTVVFLSNYYFFRLIRCRSMPFRILGSIALGVISTVITVPASELISQFLELPSQHVMGSW